MSEAGGTTQQDEVAVHPRKRKLRPKTEAQSREQADNKEVVLEKPPNPYELYLNLRRQVIAKDETFGVDFSKMCSEFTKC